MAPWLRYQASVGASSALHAPCFIGFLLLSLELAGRLSFLSRRFSRSVYLDRTGLEKKSVRVGDLLGVWLWSFAM